MAYVYKHIRLDTNEIFYIGVGSDKPYYKRARTQYSRNKHWKNIVNKTSYKIEIIKDDLDFNSALLLEIELIAKYKFISDGGTLVNYTKGGQGQLGLTPPTAKPIYGQNLITKEIKKFNSILDASKELNIIRSSIVSVLKQENQYAGGWIFNTNKKLLDINIVNYNPNISYGKKTPLYATNIKIFDPKFFESNSECLRYYKQNKFTISHISLVRRGIENSHKNYIFADSINELQFKFNNLNNI